MGTKTRTKLYSTLLSIMMLVNLVPTPALAEGEPQPTETPVIVQTETPAAEPENNTVVEPTPTPVTEPTFTEEVPVIPVEGNTEPASTETPAPEQEEKQDEESKETEADSKEDTEESEETELEETEDEEVSYPAVTLSETVEGVTVTLKAPEGSLPEGVHMTVEPVHNQEIFEAVDGTLAEEGRELASAVAFDITLYDAKENELQPNKYVTVSFSDTNLSSAEGDGSIDVYRVSDDASEVTPVTTIAATDNNQMFITDHFTIYLASSNKKTIHGSLEDPNGDGTNQPNGQGHRYYLEYGETITLSTNESSIFTDEWYIHGCTYHGAITQIGESSTFKNTNTLKSYEIATIAHKYGFLGNNVEYFFVSLKPQETFNVTFNFKDIGETTFKTEDGYPKLEERYRIITPPSHDGSIYKDGKLYIFSGWCSDEACTKVIPSSTFYGLKQDIKAYAMYNQAPNAYAIVYNGNADDCTFVPAPQYSTSNVFNNITREYPERPGYVFTDWTDTPNGAPKYSYYKHEQITVPSGQNVFELYATWEESTISIFYEYDNYEQQRYWGDIKPRGEYNINAVNGKVYGSTATPRPGYRFVRWRDKDGNTLSTKPTFVPDKIGGKYYERAEYFAVFEPISYTVTFNTNGGNEIPSQTVNHGAKVTQPTNPAKGPDTCFKFEGWYSDSTLKTRFDFNTAITSDKILYAKWVSDNHQRDKLEGREEPTCEKAGHVAGYTCVKCNKHFSDPNCTIEISDEAWVLPALGHDWEAPTYSWNNNGFEEITASRKCRRDANHTETETLNGSQITSREHAATCTTPGGISYIAVFNNSAFKVQIKTVQTHAALGHKWETPTYTWSDDNSGVVAVAHCGRDRTHVEAEATTTTKVINRAATCEGTGEATYTATFAKAPFNGDSQSVHSKTVVLPALGHDWDVTYSEWDTDHQKCTATATCKRDPNHTSTEEVAWKPVEVEATCESPGGISYVATFETPGFGIHQDFVPASGSEALGHDYGPARYDWNEDNSAVIAIRHCSRDYRHVDAAGVETEKTVRKEPTCTETGLANYTATFSDPYVTQTRDVVIPALGHDWGEWEIVKDPTAVEEGLKQRVCAHDKSHVETEALPKVTYSVKTGDGQTWTKGSNVTADFEFERSEENEAKKLTAYDLFTEVQIDGTKISSFKKEKGSVITKIYASYLETLSAGDHKITAKFSDGGSVTASFTVKDKEPAPTPDEKKSSGGSSTPAAPVDNVVTCQMAGYPANYSWNEAAKACQPGYIDAAGNFHPYSTRERAVPNTYDQGLAVHTWILGISALTAVFCALSLRRDSLY